MALLSIGRAVAQQRHALLAREALNQTERELPGATDGQRLIELRLSQIAAAECLLSLTPSGRTAACDQRHPFAPRLAGALHANAKA